MCWSAKHEAHNTAKHVFAKCSSVPVLKTLFVMQGSSFHRWAQHWCWALIITSMLPDICTSERKEIRVLTCMFLCRVIPQFMLVGLALQNLSYKRTAYLTNGRHIDFKPTRLLGYWQTMFLNLNRLHSLLLCSKAVTSPWAMAWVERAFTVSITNSSLLVCLP